MRLRVQITKEKGIRFISHLEYMSTLTRALRRSGIPVAYSEGFNPHMRFSLASALGVGITSQAEFAEIELAEEIGAAEAMEKFRAALPMGIHVKAADIVDSKTPKLMATAAGADYRVEVPLAGGTGEEVLTALAAFNGAPTVPLVKHMPKGKIRNKEIDVKDYVPAITGEINGDMLVLSFSIIITPTGSMKVSELLTVLREQFDLPLLQEQADICRLDIYRTDAKGRRRALLSPQKI